MKLWFTGLLLLMVNVAIANDFATNTAEGHDFANQQKAYVQGLANGSDARASSYGGNTQISEQTHPCNQVNEQGQKTCGGETANPHDNPTQYYGMSRAQLEDAARLKASTDENAKYVIGAHDQRPQFDMTPDDPLFKNEAENQENMTALTSTYSGCKDIKYGSGGAEENKTCTKSGYRTSIENTCRRTYTGKCNWVSSHQFEIYLNNQKQNTIKKTEPVLYIHTGNGRMGSQASSVEYIHHDLNPDMTKAGTVFRWTVKMSSFTSQTSLFIQYRKWVADHDSKTAHRPVLKINGVVVPSSVAHGGLGKKNYRFWGYWGNLRAYMKEGDNTVELGSGKNNGKIAALEVGKMANMVEAMHCEQQYTSDLMCSEGGIAGATFVRSTCLDNEDRVIDGVTFQRACWVEDEVYQRPGPVAYSEEPLCKELREQGCGSTGNTCTKWHPEGWCQTATINFTCQGGPTQTMQVCGESLVCPDGKCYDAYHTPEPDNKKDFATAASYIAAMQDMKKEFDPDNITVWKGEFKQCKVKDSVIGGNRCCTGGTGFLSTWGGGCDANEEQIAKAKQDERVTFLRERVECEQRIAGSCVLEVTYMEFCTWPSKLARIVQDQGRPMLGQRVDKPCPGYKLQNPNEFMGINWDLIDLSDYFKDVETKYNNTTKPDGEELKYQQQQSADAVSDEYAKKYKQYYGE